MRMGPRTQLTIDWNPPREESRVEPVAETPPVADAPQDDSWKMCPAACLVLPPALLEKVMQNFTTCGQLSAWLCDVNAEKISGIGDSKKDLISDAIVKISGTKLIANGVPRD